MIYFRAQMEYDGGDLFANDAEQKHSPMKMKRHIQNGSKSNKNSPYISLTEEVGIAVLKYSYGKSKNSDGKYLFNSPQRGKILLVNMDDNDALSDVEAPNDTASNAYYPYRAIQNYFKKKKLTFGGADHEAIAFHKITKDKVYEIHPLLADMLVGLRYCISRNPEDQVDLSLRKESYNQKDAKQLYDDIINGIMSGIYSFQHIEEMMESIEMNESEKVFWKSFYSDRRDFESTFNNVFPQLSGEAMDNGKKLLYITCMRTGIIKRSLSHFIKSNYPNIDSNLASEFMLPMEEDVGASGIEQKLDRARIYGNIFVDAPYNPEITIVQGKKKRDLVKKIPCGIDYTYDENGRVIDVICQYNQITKSNDGPKDGTRFLIEKNVREQIKIAKGNPVRQEEKEANISHKDEGGAKGANTDVVALNTIQSANSETLCDMLRTSGGHNGYSAEELLRKVIELSIDSISIASFDRGRKTEYTVDREDLVNTSEESFCYHVIKNFFDSNVQRESAAKYKQECQKFVRAVLTLVHEDENINVAEAFDDAIEARNQESERVINVARQEMKNAKEIKRMKERKEKEELKGKTARKRFFETYGENDRE